MWIETGGFGPLPKAVAAHLSDLRREDKQDHAWINLDTGALLRLTCIGGWRDPEHSHYSLFLYPIGGEPLDLTFPILGRAIIPFDVNEKGAATYSRVHDEATELVSKRIGAHRLYEQES